MKEDKENINSFLNITQATFLIVLILTIYFVIVTLKNYPITLDIFFNPFLIIGLFYFTVAGFIFSAIFQYLNKKFPLALYSLLFFYCLWALIFVLSNSAEKKHNNQIPDIMDGVSESITIFLIKIIFISIISNFIVILKNRYFTKEDTL